MVAAVKLFRCWSNRTAQRRRRQRMVAALARRRPFRRWRWSGAREFGPGCTVVDGIRTAIGAAVPTIARIFGFDWAKSMLFIVFSPPLAIVPAIPPAAGDVVSDVCPKPLMSPNALNSGVPVGGATIFKADVNSIPVSGKYQLLAAVSSRGAVGVIGGPEPLAGAVHHVGRAERIDRDRRGPVADAVTERGDPRRADVFRVVLNPP